jgi:peptidoglycan/LPS O-acetylase OafA/YrhL
MPALTTGGLPHLHVHREQQRERHRATSWAVPVVLGIAYGTYALWLDSNSPQPTPTAALLGLIAAIVMGVLCYVVGRAQPRWSAETRGIVYGVLFGVGMGFWISLARSSSDLKSAMIALACGAGMGICAFYISYGGREYQKGAEHPEPGKSVERVERSEREIDEARSRHGAG